MEAIRRNPKPFAFGLLCLLALIVSVFLPRGGGPEQVIRKEGEVYRQVRVESGSPADPASGVTTNTIMRMETENVKVQFNKVTPAPKDEPLPVPSFGAPAEERDN